MRAMVKLKEQGKIRAIGVSNYDVHWLRNAEQVTKIASNQPPYSLMQRRIERDILPYCCEHKIGVIVYSPLERGLLAGAVPPERECPEGDHRRTHKFFTPEMRRKVLASLEKIRAIKDRHNASFAQLAINWTVHEPGITAALVGARNAEQATHNAAALNFTLTNDERKQIRAAFDDVAVTS